MNPLLPGAVCATLLAGLNVSAATNAISINFGNTTVSTTAGGPAVAASGGVVNTLFPNWNNVTGTVANGSASGLQAYNYRTGASSATGAGVSWTSANLWTLATSAGTNIAGGQNPTMMGSYLDGANTSATVTGLNAALGGSPYAVLIYFDGSNDASWRTARYTIGSTSYTGEDSESTNFNNGAGQNPNGVFQLPVAGGTGNAPFGTTTGNNSEGNYFLFRNLSSDSFTLTGTGVGGSGLRAPINGIQIIAIPEPGALSLAGLGLVAVGSRRRRR